MNNIKTYFGTYIGFSPTDESKIGLGEIEMIIDEHGLKMRHATGLTIREETALLEQVRELTGDEVRSHFIADSDQHTRVDGFQVGRGAVLLFWKEPTVDESRLIVRLGEFVEILGPTMLYDAYQVAEGAFDRVIDEIAELGGAYAFPRLEYGGLHEPRAI